MTDTKLIETIYRRLDGELSEAEHAEFDLYLSAHPEALLLFRQCESIKKQFGEGFETNPPDDLKPAIMKSLNPALYKAKEAVPEIKIFSSFWQRPAFKFGLTFAMGVFLGFLFFSVLKSGIKTGVNEDNLKGTLFVPTAAGPLKTADVLVFEGASSRAVWKVRYSAAMVEIQLSVSSATQIRSTLDFRSESFQVMSVRNVSVNSQSSVISAANSVQVNNIGDNQYLIQLLIKKGGPQDFGLAVFQDNQQIYQNSVTVN